MQAWKKQKRAPFHETDNLQHCSISYFYLSSIFSKFSFLFQFPSWSSLYITDGDIFSTQISLVEYKALEISYFNKLFWHALNAISLGKAEFHEFIQVLKFAYYEIFNCLCLRSDNLTTRRVSTNATYLSHDKSTAETGE